ncbi:hypothetical protein [Edaphobacter modestus]|uniref:ATP dependent DNA ligase n=1 Tax=Edaphobacter modestus TaxID=388466 RepID=UPI00102C3613
MRALAPLIRSRLWLVRDLRYQGSPLRRGWPFCNLPERSAGQWGEGLTREKMSQVIWLKPIAVAQIEFLEWTSVERLRHTKFIAMRHDKDALTVTRET